MLDRVDTLPKLVPPEDAAITTLYIGGLTPVITEDDIRDQFYGYGELQSVKKVTWLLLKLSWTAQLFCRCLTQLVAVCCMILLGCVCCFCFCCFTPIIVSDTDDTSNGTGIFCLRMPFVATCPVYADMEQLLCRLNGSIVLLSHLQVDSQLKALQRHSVTD